MSKLNKTTKKTSLNIKIDPELDLRLKRMRIKARENGLMFNVSQIVSKELDKQLKLAEKELGLTQSALEAESQVKLFEN